MSKFCRYCGFEMNDDALFCGNCGQKVEQPAQPEQPVQSVQAEQPVEQTYGDNFQGEQQPNPVQPYQNQFYYEQSVQFTAQPKVKQKTPGKGFGIASLVLGIVAFVNCISLALFDFSAITVNNYNYTDRYITSVANFGLFFVIFGFGIFIIILALLSLTFAIVALIKGKKGTSVAGLILSILSILVCIFSFVLAASLDKPTMYDMAHKHYSTFDSNYDDQLDKYEDQIKDFITDD